MARKVRVGTIARLVKDRPVKMEENLRRCESLLKEAYREKCDLVLLPEFFNIHGSLEAEKAEKNISRLAESIPGPLSERIGKIAKKQQMYIIATYPEKSGHKTYNTAVIIDRKGKVAGKYRKTHPTASEIREKKITPGNALPVFNLDFGKVGIMICMDIYFPEAVRVMTLKGAEIIFWPTMAQGPSEYTLKTQFCSRAIDYKCYMVTSNYACEPPYAPYAGRSAPGNSYIVDLYGHIIADTGHRAGLATATIDLDAPHLGVGVIGLREGDYDDLKRDMLKLRRPELYSEICKPVDNQNYLKGIVIKGK